MNQQQILKKNVALEAANLIKKYVGANGVLGVGTGSTANFFIDLLAETCKDYLTATVASSEATKERLEKHGFKVIDLNQLTDLALYVDGADEVDAQGHMIKGGGGALTREKIVAAVARQFICVVDASKQVQQLGDFPLPIEIIPQAREHVKRQVALLGGEAVLRSGFVTDNGNCILDIHRLAITDPLTLEVQLNNITGVVCSGLFAHRKADLVLAGHDHGVNHLKIS